MYVLIYLVNFGDITDTRTFIDAYVDNDFKIPTGFIPTVDRKNVYEYTDYHGNTTYMVVCANLIDFVKACTDINDGI